MLELYGHPFSSYTWKALIPLYANDTAFAFRQLGPDHPEHGEALARHSPMGKFPLLVEGDRVVFEASAIIDYLDLHHPGAMRFVPADPDAALEMRMMDRVFDNYVMTPMQRIVTDAMRPEGERDPAAVAQAQDELDRIYAWLDGRVAGYATAGAHLTLCDCAAAPSLFYADWVQPIAADHVALRAYRARLLAHPVVARVVDDARPYRALFPLGAPDRD